MDTIKTQNMKSILCKLLFLFFGISACAQAPDNRPDIENPDFDKRLTNLLSFSVPLMGVQELAANKEEIYILDAREEAEYEVSHIPGARYIGYDKFKKKAVSDIPKDAKIVVYCSVGYRSEKIGEKLKKQGFEDVSNLYGSIFEWVNAGNAVENAKGEKIKAVHTYNKKWSQWVIDGRAEKVY